MQYLKTLPRLTTTRYITYLLFMFIALSNCKIAFGQDTSHPNFIIILADDQGYNDVGCYGSALIKTPNLDRMAEEGWRLTSFYAQPLCGPSRAALLTGSYPIRIGEVGNLKRPHPMVHPDEILIPEILKQGGYQTACIGKWDINGHQQTFSRNDLLPTRMGFDYWFGLPSSVDDGVKAVYRNETILDTTLTVNGLTKTYTQEAINFIEKNRAKPFFLYLAHSMPHTRLGASEGFKGKSRDGLYGDAVEELDWSTGMILEKLKELGLSDNTYVIYTSDNGPWSARGTNAGSAYPLRGDKVSTWEGGVRVPCIIWGKKLAGKGKTCDKVISTMDMLPTLASLGGVKLPANHTFDGNDISKLLTAGDATGLEEVYYYYIETHLQAVRKGDWKLVLPRPQAPEWITLSKKSIWIYNDMDPVRAIELYDLKNDPGERRDIADQHPGVVKELRTLIDKARNELGDYNQVGSGARFYEEGVRRPDAIKWQEKEKSGWKQEIKIHPYYDDGGRIL